MYEATFCVWLLSFVPSAVDTLVSAQALPALVEIGKAISKEKVVRMVVLSLKNILDIEGVGQFWGFSCCFRNPEIVAVDFRSCSFCDDMYK